MHLGNIAGWRVSKVLLAESYLLYMYSTYVNQMNLNGKLRKKLGGPNRRPSNNLGGPWPPLESPLPSIGVRCSKRKSILHTDNLSLF